MSCKVFAGSDTVSFRKLFERPQQKQEDRGSDVACSRAEPSEDPAEVIALRARVSELEESLRREAVRAREAGFREGQTAGLEQGKAEVTPALERLSCAIADLAGLRARIRQESERELVMLSIAIARRLLRRELTVDPEAVHGLVKAALDKVQARDIRRIRSHPDFCPVLKRRLELLGVTGAEIEADGSLTPGDVIVETRHGDLDASIGSQLAEIERGFADRLRR